MDKLLKKYKDLHKRHLQNLDRDREEKFSQSLFKYLLDYFVNDFEFKVKLYFEHSDFSCGQFTSSYKYKFDDVYLKYSLYPFFHNDDLTEFCKGLTDELRKKYDGFNVKVIGQKNHFKEGKADVVKFYFQFNF